MAADTAKWCASWKERVGDESKPTPPCLWATPDNRRSQQKCRCSGVSRQQKTFSEALAARKKSHGRTHKSPCVICLGTFVTSAGACDFTLALYFLNLAASRLNTSYGLRWKSQSVRPLFNPFHAEAISSNNSFCEELHWSLLVRAHAAVRLLHA